MTSSDPLAPPRVPAAGASEPLVVQRPSFLVSAMPAIQAALLTTWLVSNARSASDLMTVLAAVALTGWLGFRATTSRLTLDEFGVTCRGVWRTRRLGWDRIARLHTRGDGQGRARVEVVLDSEERTTIWSGPVNDPLLAQMATYGDGRARGESGSRRRGLGCVLAFTVALALFGTLVTASALTNETAVTVAQGSIPPGVEAWVLMDAEGRPTSAPRVECASVLRPTDDWEPPACEAARRGQTRWALGFGVATLVSWAVVLAAYRARRRDRARRREPWSGELVGRAPGPVCRGA